MRLTAAQAIVKFLDNQYVEFDGDVTKFVEGVFTVFGHGIVLGLGEALQTVNENLQVYQGKNEQGMAHTAIAFAKQNNRRKILACASSIGPGSANMVTAAACATVNCVPLLLFCGDTYATRQPDPVLQQVEQSSNLNITTTDAFKPVVKFWDRIVRPEQVMTAMINAMRVLTDMENTGAVMLALPQDVQGEVYDYPECFFEKRITKIRRYNATKEDIAYLADAIKKAKKPLFVCGGGVRYSEAGEFLQEMCQKRNIPYGETQSGKSATKSSSAMNLGGLGVTGNLAANEWATQADLVVGLGTRFSDFTTASKSLYPDTQIVSVNTSMYHASKMDAYPVKGDVLEVLKSLDEALGDFVNTIVDVKPLKKAWAEEMLKLRAYCYDDKFKPLVNNGNRATIDEFAKLHNTVLTQTAALAVCMDSAQDGIAVGASGSLPGCMQRMWETENKDSYNMEYGYSTMGYEIAGTLGVKLACPDKEAYSFVGDGSFQMLHSEMVTALQEKKKINVLLFDNASFGCINNLQTSKGIESNATETRYRGDKLDGALIAIDYAKIAEGYGMKGYTARTLDELKAALADAKLQDVSILIDIKVLPKTMTDGYSAWWNTGTPELSTSDKVQKASNENMISRKIARKY